MADVEQQETPATQPQPEDAQVAPIDQARADDAPAEEMDDPDQQVEELPENEQVEYLELVKSEVLATYKQNCETFELEPHEAFVAYLEETYAENEGIDLVIQGNDKYNFTNRVDDKCLMVLCRTLRQYAIYIEDIDLRYNHITD